MDTHAVEATAVERVFRQEAGRALATLIRLLGDFDLAEDALQDAFAAALAQWPAAGIPDNPRAYLVRVARNKAIDRLRRRSRGAARQRDLAIETAVLADHTPPGSPDCGDDDPFGDDILRLIFTCCHPALAIEARVALTLNAVCGLSARQLARAFLVRKGTMAQRLVRTKKKIRLAGIPYATPDASMLDGRIDDVLSVIYLVFNEGYAVTEGNCLLRDDLAREAIRLGRLLDSLVPDRPAIQGLLALMLLHHARRAARVTPEGDVVLLEDQDRSRWDRHAIADGLALVEAALRRGGWPSPYTIQAAIAALHARAPRHEDTDWAQIAGLYGVLMRFAPSPVVELNHAVAVAMVGGPERGLELLDALSASGRLDGYHLLPAARADLLRRLDRRDEARSAYRAALAQARLAPERRLLMRRLAELD